MSLVPLKPLLALVMLATAAHFGPNYSYEHCKPAQISFQVPRTWVADNEQTLFAQGFVIPPMPLYAMVAAPTAIPSRVAFNPSSVPWVFVTVETVSDMLPPAQLYELAPNYLEYLATEAGPTVTTTVKTLVAPNRVRQGGLSGSTAAMTVVSKGSSTSFEDLAYERGSQLWLVIAGCSSACYSHNAGAITQIVNSVRVGTAS
jgi:hypothetical protein